MARMSTNDGEGDAQRGSDEQKVVQAHDGDGDVLDAGGMLATALGNTCFGIGGVSNAGSTANRQTTVLTNRSS